MVSSFSNDADARAFAVLSNPPSVVACKLFGSTVVYELPNLDTLAVVFRPLMAHILPSPVSGEMLGIGLRVPNGKPGPPGSMELLRISLPSGDVLDSIEFVSPATHGGVTTFRPYGGPLDWNDVVALSPDGSKLYMTGRDDAGPALFCFDVNTGYCYFRTPGIERAPYVSADGREVWVISYPFTSPDDTTKSVPSHLLFLDGGSGQILDSLPIPIANHVEFHPERPEAYVSCGYSRPGLLVINTVSRSIVGTMYDSAGAVIMDAVIASRF